MQNILSRPSKGKYGNLIFDLPYHIPGGKYNIEVNILSDKGHVYARNSITLDRSELKPYFYAKKKNIKTHFEEVPQPKEKINSLPSETDKKIGYVLFSRSPLEYVFLGTRPRKKGDRRKGTGK